ncbi:MAG: hypothetical protein RLZZ399_985 [Verrucomicrobiota bacterium]|jgi:hypothetical protein
MQSPSAVPSTPSSWAFPSGHVGSRWVTLGHVGSRWVTLDYHLKWAGSTDALRDQPGGLAAISRAVALCATPGPPTKNVPIPKGWWRCGNPGSRRRKPYGAAHRGTWFSRSHQCATRRLINSEPDFYHMTPHLPFHPSGDALTPVRGESFILSVDDVSPFPLSFRKRV